MTKTPKYLSFLLTLILLPQIALAHEYWFEPESFRLAPSAETAVHLYVGDGIRKEREERVFQPEMTPKFQLFSKDGVIDLKPSIREGASPIYNFSAAKAGNFLFGMERNWSYITLEADKFEDYLREDGIDYISAERRKLGETAKPGRERYSRYIKSLLMVGDKRDATYKRQLGMKLEITPLENPYAKKVGDTLQFKITFDGKPLASRTVFADNRESETQRMTTDKNGIVSVKLDRKGMWIVRLVTMRRCANDCGEADWESFWGALTFGI